MSDIRQPDPVIDDPNETPSPGRPLDPDVIIPENDPDNGGAGAPGRTGIEEPDDVDPAGIEPDPEERGGRLPPDIERG